MQKNNLKNIFIQALKPQRFFVMFHKVLSRFFDHSGNLSTQENLLWIKKHCSDFAALAKNLDSCLWQETQIFSNQLEEKSQKILASVEYDLGGGGIYPLLYFITRYTKPNCIVETGVAAGFSSSSFLSAIEKNGHGKLYSSDFPYFRLPNPEKYIGIVVDHSLKRNWHLFIEGDAKNLPKIVAETDTIEIFHYDSDKTYRGRKSALSIVKKAFAENTIVLIDDIQDNSFFHDYIEKTKPSAWHIFEFQKKYIGMVGTIKTF